MKSLQTAIEAELNESANVLNNFISDPRNLSLIESSAKLMVESIQSGGKIISCGNGGSCCDAMHFAEELSGRYRQDRTPIAAISISDPSHITCVGNDYGYQEVFARYVQALGNPNDTLLAISTSGNSPNVIRAIEEARKKGMTIIGLTGKDGGKMKDLCDEVIVVSHHGFADRIQEVHIKVIHIFVLLIEKMLQENVS